MNRAGEVRYQDILAGVLIESEDGYSFTYNAAYLSDANPPVSLTLPLRDEPYLSRGMFPFFDGLICPKTKT